MTSMPDEFMRGGGCFAPEATVTCVDAASGAEQAVPVSTVQPGMQIRTGSGGTTTVLCVVESACEGGQAVLTQLPGGGPQLTEWHPVRDPAGRWRFPIMLGERVVRPCPKVFNLVLADEHVAMVGGVQCCTLGHGLQGPVIGHPFWGTTAVLEQLATHDGWESGRVVLASPLRAPLATDTALDAPASRAQSDVPSCAPSHSTAKAYVSETCASTMAESRVHARQLQVVQAMA